MVELYCILYDISEMSMYMIAYISFVVFISATATGLQIEYRQY